MSEDSLFDLCERLFPLPRSITGHGVRQTLEILQEKIPIEILNVPSGTPIFDWQVPLEWNLNRAYVEGPSGEIIIDSDANNLHVVGYSNPINIELDLDELQSHLHSIPESPTLIPYRTSYYDDTWGFCISHDQRRDLPPGKYRVVVDANLAPGGLTYGELSIPGRSGHEYLVSTHVCHPSLANDNLSGISVATQLAQKFLNRGHLEHGLKFIFIPGTIGAIAWLAQNRDLLPKNLGTLVLSGVGDRGPFTYKKSRHGSGVFDCLFEDELSLHKGATIRPYLPYGYDERQFCSPGINLEAGCLMRTPYGEYPEYHTSGDDLNNITAEALDGTLELCERVVEKALAQQFFVNLAPECEPQLGKRGLYNQIGGENQSKEAQLALLWMLSYSSGNISMQQISRLSGVDLEILHQAANRLIEASLLIPLGEDA